MGRDRPWLTAVKVLVGPASSVRLAVAYELRISLGQALCPQQAACYVVTLDVTGELDMTVHGFMVAREARLREI